MTLWEVEIHPAAGLPDRTAEEVLSDARDLGLAPDRLRTARAFLLEGELTRDDAESIAQRLLADAIVERFRVDTPEQLGVSHPDDTFASLIQVRYKPGVMDPVAQSTLEAVAELGWDLDAVATLRKYWIDGLDTDACHLLVKRVLANDSIEHVDFGPLQVTHLRHEHQYRFELRRVPIRDLDENALKKLSREGQLYLSLVEMQTIQAFYRELGREPTDVELETIAQTWSEHCSHKTLAGRIAYRDENGTRHFENMLKETVFAATEQIRSSLGEDDWCVSVFRDNAGVVRFDDRYHVAFKVETHNHPSALEPYGGANTGLGGVIRDTLGTGLGAKPICSTDVFCFAPPDLPGDALPPGVLHPRRVMKGV
ncbi:MAG TPA: phosphoribosylformylglycinamidine synthase, partial [Planctomycetaceae bacterium]|nr:phosphoribosylformylglycinamidine synthase [Planctomycetaceae bacterium]